MLGLLVIIVVSWVLLHFIEKKNIEVLGIIPYPKRVAQIGLGMVFMMLLCLLWIVIETFVLNVDWQLNKNSNYAFIFDAFVYHVRSALTEDLVFRGAILYILINRIGAKWAILISAIIFGVYHVFSYGMIGENFIAIAYVIFITGFTGYVWAYTFHKTKSIMLGLGFHIGYNFLMTMFYESNPYGQLVFQELSKTILRDWNFLFFSLAKGLFPSIVTLVFVKYLVKSKYKIFSFKLTDNDENAVI
ncbi:CPBP family intramembrane glutamic endopeptidase [Psychroserpens sp. SPM9]|uniref:CPBP family intramembrane glutamic endopeptidase n=1 Tax=Psychroserpens sp. SPM9 TaxID=2975598 RepID=UPI0021A6E8AE|nr:CPBP family intramembrane glutamic endopeptidase [Psychroserpens sp. SPM9]MDG5493089.1 CPBP family intramembrane metalloprotease [Psychroserpens sp. SPM9]